MLSNIQLPNFQLPPSRILYLTSRGTVVAVAVAVAVSLSMRERADERTNSQPANMPYPISHDPFIIVAQETRTQTRTWSSASLLIIILPESDTRSHTRALLCFCFYISWTSALNSDSRFQIP